MPDPAPADVRGSAGAAPDAWASAERVARDSYGRLIAILAARTGDIELAEDALGDAFQRALASWPRSGVPVNPEGWLLTVARNRQRDVLKSAAHRSAVPLEASEPSAAAGAIDAIDPNAIPDERLALLFACAHPAIDESVRTPLMLQVVLGIDAKRIARAFVIPAPTVAQRLVRAKRRIRNARISFAVPDRERLTERLASVLEAIYGAYAVDWQFVSGPTPRASLAYEAHHLAVTLAELLPNEPEALGLAALISFSMSRVDARTIGNGFVPLEEQDPTLWDARLIAEGERYLRRAHAAGRIGRFQLEAAIQSAHCARAATGEIDWAALRRIYSVLVSIAPTIGSRVAHAVTVGRIDGPAAGLAALDGIDDPGMSRFQPAWAARAHLLAGAGRATEAELAYRKAISLTTETGLRRYLETRLQALRSPDSNPPG